MLAALPPYGDYLRQIIALGKRTIPRTLPALAFLYFYRLGMGLFLAVSPTSGATLDEAERSFGTLLMVTCAYIPVILCLFAPMLHVEDGLLRGEPHGFLDGVRRVLRVVWKLVLSQLAQAVVVVGPLAALAVFAYLILSRFESLPPNFGAMIAIVAALPALFWFFLTSFLFLFAMTALVLDLEGPVQSIRTSVRLVRIHFGGVLGRLFVYVFLSFIVAMVAAAPSSFLAAAIAASGNENPMLRIPGVVWESAVEALLFPFGVAAVVLLYRALVPASAVVAVGAPALAGTSAEESRLTTSPFPFE